MYFWNLYCVTERFTYKETGVKGLLYIRGRCYC